MNLAGKANKGLIDYYSSGKVIKAREYQEEKERLRIAKEEAKLERKIKRAVNALRKKQEKVKRAADREAKAVQKQLAGDIELAAKRVPKKQPVSIAPKAKKAAPVVLTKRKVPIKARCPVKVVVQQEVIAQISKVVTSGVV